MEGGSVGHNNFERNPPRDHPYQVWFNLVQGFQRRRFKCEILRLTTDGRRRTPSDGKISPDLRPGELKRTAFSSKLKESHKRTHNYASTWHMKRAKKSLKIPESATRRTDNTMAKIKRTNNALQNIIYTTRTPL
jgi:hypothetical protein